MLRFSENIAARMVAEKTRADNISEIKELTYRRPGLLACATQEWKVMEIWHSKS